MTLELLKQSYFALKRKAAAGVDGVTWQAYGEGLRENRAFKDYQEIKITVQQVDVANKGNVC